MGVITVTYLTRAQRVALKKLWLEQVAPESKYIKVWKLHIGIPGVGISYREFRKTVSGLIGGNGCVMVCIERLWYGIETDGYRHT